MDHSLSVFDGLVRKVAIEKGEDILFLGVLAAILSIKGFDTSLLSFRRDVSLGGKSVHLNLKRGIRGRS
jgi:hypothetical protein